MNYYHDLITIKSWQVLQKLQKEIRFVLIGGWAVWLYAKTLKSKDIDLIVDYKELEKIKNNYELIKNNRLKKYEIKIEEISIDIYTPFYSNLGVPVEEINNRVENLSGFTVPKKEMLLILKQQAYQDRKLSIKGRKDLIDILSLILLPDFAWGQYKNLLKLYQLTSFLSDLEEIIRKTREVNELNLNQHQFSRLKKNLLGNIIQKCSKRLPD